MSNAARTIEDLLDDLFPAYARGRKPMWPPDAFAVAASVLKQSGAYTEIVHRWPPVTYSTINDWQRHVEGVAEEWRRVYRTTRPAWPAAMDPRWALLIANKSLKIEDVKYDGGLVDCLMAIVAAADQTCFNMGVLEMAEDSMSLKALELLYERGTLCLNIHSSRATVLPKKHNPLSGITIRSLTHNLALWDRPEVTPRWTSIDMNTLEHGLNLLLLPWPLEISPSSFRSEKISDERMPDDFGFFAYDIPKSHARAGRVRALKARAEAMVGPVAAVVLPELSVTINEFRRLQSELSGTVLIAGIGFPSKNGMPGANLFGISTGFRDLFSSIFQSKHHRWRIDPQQIAQYGFGPSLVGKKSLWEAIGIPARLCTFVDVKRWLTFCVLICEDLARQDPVAELVRSVGPNLVIALLLDGPQVPERWSARYATVLAEDPRSSVLTLTSAGLVDLAIAQGNPGPRSIGLWKDAISGARKIILDPGSEGVVLSLSRRSEMEWVADGRHDNGVTGYLELTGVHQVRLPAGGGGATRRPERAKKETRAR
jgi:hypothetical protein